MARPTSPSSPSPRASAPRRWRRPYTPAWSTSARTTPRTWRGRPARCLRPRRAAKNGCRPEEAPGLIDDLLGLGLDVRGLMTVGRAGPPEEARAGFRRLTEIADQLGLPERSMGMTDDLEVAVQEGTTMVRVGRALFGARPVPSDLRR
ncbi:MAG: alanine racemase [Actinobacteria bacterium]|nr:alanine racemase [Actinomycetota bacterium]